MNGVYDLRTPFPIASDRFPELLVKCLYLYLNILRIHEVLQLKFGNLEAGRACNEIHLALQCNNKKRRLIGIDFNYCEKKTVVSNVCFKHLAKHYKINPSNVLLR